MGKKKIEGIWIWVLHRPMRCRFKTDVWNREIGLGLQITKQGDEIMNRLDSEREREREREKGGKVLEGKKSYLLRVHIFGSIFFLGFVRI